MWLVGVRAGCRIMVVRTLGVGIARVRFSAARLNEVKEVSSRLLRRETRHIQKQVRCLFLNWAAWFTLELFGD